MDTKIPPEPKHSLQYPLQWNELMESHEFQKEFCGDILEDYIVQQRWYGGKASKLKYIEVLDYFKVQNESDLYYGLVIEVNYIEAFVQEYFLPLGLVKDPDAVDGKVIARIQLNKDSFWLVDATLLESFRKLVFEKITEGNKIEHPYLEYRRGRKCLDDEYQSSRFLGVEQSNTSIIYNDKYILKFFRRLYVNHNPDYELSKYLTNKGQFNNTPGYAGSITLKFSDKNVMTIALMQEMIPNKGDAWEYFSDKIRLGIQEFNASSLALSSIQKLNQLQQIHLNQVDEHLVLFFGKDFFEDIKT